MEPKSIPSIIYKQFAKYIPLDEMKGLQWFALIPNYGSEYGNIQKTYRFIKQPRLLNIGNADVRSEIRKTIEPLQPKIIDLSDPDTQYSGGQKNKEYHSLVEKYFGNTYDGTFIDENQLQGNQDYSKEDLEGPSEIVLWRDYPELLEEIEKKGGKRKRRKTRKRRKLRRSTKKSFSHYNH